MAYDADLDSTHNPTTGGIAPASWGDLVNGNFADMGAWTTYTVTMTTTATNPTLGNSTLNGWYQQRNQFLIMKVELTIGSTFSAGSGTYQFSTPATLASSDAAEGMGFVRDDSSTSRYPFLVTANSTTTVFGITTHDRLALTNTQPITWATGDEVRFTAICRAA